MNLTKSNAFSGIKWSAASQLGRQGTQLLTTVILAHLLSPSDFGLLGMAMVIIGFINIFKDLGTSAAIIQQIEPSAALLSSVFWVNVGFGFFATAMLFILAPLGGQLYQEPTVTVVLQMLSPSFFISGLGVLHQALLERSLAFNSLAKLEITSVIAGAVVGILLAIFKVGVWSLVFQSLTTTSLGTILLWLSSSWRPRRIILWQDLKVVSSFSLHLTGFSIFNYFARNADYFLIGRFLGAEALGYYTLAYRILLFPLQNISDVIRRVIYPVLATIQNDNKKLGSVYLKVIQLISIISFPLMLGLLSLAGPLVLTFFGQTWEPVILLVMIFAPVGMAQSIGTTVGMIYQAKGRTDWMFRWGIGSGLFVVIAFIVGLRWGITGMAIAYAIATFTLAYPSFLIPLRLIDLNLIEMLKVLRISFVNSGLMFLAVLAFRAVLPTKLSNTVVLISSFILGVAVYGLVSWYTNQEQIKELWQLTGLGIGRTHETE